ncbi:MAG: alpha/beta hydrolase [Weeksellaceae bacterium]
MLHFKISGQGNAVVLIHGYLENMRMWEDYTQTLAAYYQVVVVDLPGHGKSAVFGEVHSMEMMAEKINEILEDAGISNAMVIGHSMGGYVTLALAELFPDKVKGFVLMNSSTLPDSDEKKELRLRAVETAEKNLNLLVKMSVPQLFAKENLDKMHAEKDFVTEMALETSVQGVTAALKGMRLRPDRTRVLHDFQGEIGIIIGNLDKTVDPAAFQEIIPERENIQILKQNTGHLAFLEARENTLQFLLAFANAVFTN